MKQVTIDGQPGTALWDDEGPLIAFRPHGTSEWRYVDRQRMKNSEIIMYEPEALIMYGPDLQAAAQTFISDLAQTLHRYRRGIWHTDYEEAE